MAKTIRLDIITPERIVFSQEVNMAIVRAMDGDIGILPGHAPLITALEVWPLRIVRDEGEALAAVAGGFMEVKPDKVTVLASAAELPEEIDVQRAEASRERAENRLKNSDDDLDIIRAEASLRRAVTRLKVADADKIR